MSVARLVVVLALLAGGSVAWTRAAQEQSKPETESDKRPSLTPENFSPPGFLDLHAYEQAYPATPRHPALVRATLNKYWIFRGIAYRGRVATDAAWTSLGPETSIQNPGSGSTETVSGRVAALAISPTCEEEGPCRLWVG